MSKILPDAWRWYQPIAFGFLAGVGWRLLDYVWPAVARFLP